MLIKTNNQTIQASPDVAFVFKSKEESEAFMKSLRAITSFVSANEEQYYIYIGSEPVGLTEEEKVLLVESETIEI